MPESWENLLKTEYTELVGVRIRRLRASRGWTQMETVRRIQRPRGGTYSPALLSRVENGYANPPLYVYLHVAEVFDLDPGRLLGTEEAQKHITEAEMTLVRFLRRAGMTPDEAITALAARRASR